MYWSKNHQPSKADIHAEIQKEVGRLREEIRKAYQFISDAQAEIDRLKAILNKGSKSDECKKTSTEDVQKTTGANVKAIQVI